jgi:hypothetical protein
MDDYWNEPTPPLLLRKPTGKLERMSNCARIAWTKLQGLPPPAKGALWLTLLVLAACLSGCATTSMPSSEPARNPSAPPSRLSPQPPNYSQRAASDTQSWRQKLTELISKLAS